MSLTSFFSTRAKPANFTRTRNCGRAIIETTSIKPKKRSTGSPPRLA
ncbi:MAG: hypothetical protein MZU97_17610 [Bacillus subtilis]|nr:hypothetical protein [Bacillus subtilis]